MPANSNSAGVTTQPPSEGRLDSWKEIAAYLRREVRTVQRWEKKENLPVHRHLHDKLGSVFAYKSELDAWWKDRQQVLEAEEEPAETSAATEPSSALKEIAHTTAEDLPQMPSAPRPTSLFLKVVIGLLVVAAAAVVVRRLIQPRMPDASPEGKIKLIVLPFSNLSGDPAQDIFCQGLTDEMITQLARLDPKHLGVMASHTSFQMKDKSIEDIRNELSVDYVIEGSVLRAENQVRIDAHLFQASDQTQRWADSYQRDARNILALQNDVVLAIADKIRLTLTPATRARLASAATVDPEAYDAFIQGLAYWNKRSPQAVAKSVDFFASAIQKDPHYAAAYAGLADAYSILTAVPVATAPPRDAMPKAKKAADEAIRLDPSSGEAHAALALVRQSYDWDWEGAEREYQQAFAINPSYAPARQWHSLLLMAEGRHQEAHAEIESARQLDPLSPVIRATYIQSYYFARQFDRVIEECRRTLEVEPNFLLLHYHLGQALVQKRMYTEAIAELEKAQAVTGRNPAITMAIGHAYGVAGDRADAMKSLQELNAMAARGYVPALYFAAVYTGLGDKDQAFRWLDKAYDERTEYLIFLKVEPMADPLRSDPRFQSLLHRVGLAPLQN